MISKVPFFSPCTYPDFFLKQILMSYHLLVLFKNVQICSFSNMHAATLLLVFSWGPALLSACWAPESVAS